MERSRRYFLALLLFLLGVGLFGLGLFLHSRAPTPAMKYVPAWVDETGTTEYSLTPYDDEAKWDSVNRKIRRAGGYVIAVFGCFLIVVSIVGAVAPREDEMRNIRRLFAGKRAQHFH